MITILSSPQLIQPVYNPIYLRVSSDKTLEEGFNFIFDLYVNNVFVNRTKLLSIPGTTQCTYSPARILESYVSSDKSQNVINTTGTINCIDKYEIKCGEEYVVYYTYDALQKDTFTPTTLTVLSSSVLLPFIQGDSILVKQNTGFLYPKYNGVFNVVSVLTPYAVLINSTWIDPGVTVVNPGRITYADKRKTVFISDTVLLTNITDYSLHNTDWTSFGPDVCNVTLKNEPDDTLKLIVPDVGCLSGLQIANWMSALPVWIIGATYKIDFIIGSNNPSDCEWFLNVILGGTTVSYSNNGTYSVIIVCGASTPTLRFSFDLRNADTSGFGTHSLWVYNVNVTQVTPRFTGYDWNGVIQYEEVPTWDYTKYQLDGITKKFLTKQPKTVLTKLTDRGSIGFMNLLDHNLTPTREYTMILTGTNLDGTSRSPLYFTINQMNIPLFTNTRILDFPAYPWNINQLSQTLYSINGIDATSATYTLQLYKLEDPSVDPNDYIPVSEPKTFQIDQSCSKFEPVRFMFLNSLGQYDFYNATLLSRTNINIQRDSFTKTLVPGYQVGDRGKTNININSQESYIINTDWISEDTANWLSYEFFNSVEIYTLDNSTGVITPIILDNSSVEVKKRVNDKLLNYTFNYSKAVPLNTQRN